MRGRGSDLKECVGGLWDSLFAFFKFFCVSVILSTMIFFYCCYGVRGRSKAMALQRNVVYTVTRWVDGWMNGPMNGWMDVTKKYRSPRMRAGAGAGAGRLSDHCLSVLFFFGCQYFGCVFFKFYVQLYWRKGEVTQKTLQTWRQSGTVLSLFPLISSHFKSPPFLHLVLCEAHFKAVGTTQSHFSLCVCVFFKIRLWTVSWRGKKKNPRCLTES